MIADTAREELPSYDVLPVSTSRAVFTGWDRPSRRVTLLNLPRNFFLCVSCCMSSLGKGETLDPWRPPEGPRYGKVAMIHTDYACPFRAAQSQGGESLPFLLMASVRWWTVFFIAG